MHSLSFRRGAACCARLTAIICLAAALITAGLAGATEETPPDALVLLTAEGQMQLWWPRQSWLISMDLPRRLGLETPVSFQRVTMAPEDILVLDRAGRVFSVLERQLLFALPAEDGCGVDLLVERSGSFFWVLTRLGKLYPVHFSGAVIGPPLVLPTTGSLCALGQDPDGRLWVVDTRGAFTSLEGTSFPPQEPFSAKVVDLDFHPRHLVGLVLDASGALYAWGEALGENAFVLPQLGRTAAVGLEFSQSATEDYYVLGRDGSVFYSGTGLTQRVPEFLSTRYTDLAVANSDPLETLWRNHFPPLKVWVEAPASPVPSWRSTLRLEVQCAQAQDLSEFDCRLAFDPQVLRPIGILSGPLFQPAERRPVVLDDSRWQEGVVGILGVSLDKRTGRGITGSGSLLGIEMEIVQAGTSELKIEQFRASSPSLPGSPVEVILSGGQSVQVYSAQPSIHLSFKGLSAIEPLAEKVVPEVKRRVLAGERFDVYLLVDQVKAMKGIRYDLSFDADMIQFITVEERGFLAQSGRPTLFLHDPVERDGQRGELKDQGIVILGQGPGCSGPGEVIRYWFEALRPGTASIRLTQATLVDEERTRKPLEVAAARVELEIVERE